MRLQLTFLPQRQVRLRKHTLQTVHMKTVTFQNPWIAGVVGATSSWICTQLFFGGAGGRGRFGGMIVVGCIVGFSVAFGLQSKPKKLK